MEPAYSIGQMARAGDCKVQTIRYYEQKGLLPIPRRNQGNQRVYSQLQYDRLRFIRHSRELGFSLDRIRQILDLTDRVAQPLPIDRFVPAVGQGCVAVEVRRDDADTTAMVAQVDHPPTRSRVEVERAFLAELGSGCSLPVGAHVDAGVLHDGVPERDAQQHTHCAQRT